MSVTTALWVGILLLILMIVLGAISAKGMYQLGCRHNYNTIEFFFHNILNNITFGIYGLYNAYKFRQDSFVLRENV